MSRSAIQKCLQRPVIPVVWDPSAHHELIGRASMVILQGGTLAELPYVLEQFEIRQLAHLPLFAHIDLVAGLENSEAGLEYLAGLGRLTGIVTVRQHLIKPAKRLNLIAILAAFVSDSRAVERSLAVAEKSQADAIEILPAVAAVKVAADLDRLRIPRIAGGLCRTEEDIRETLASGCSAVTASRPALWQLN